jgi:hypothetical protein
LAIGVKRKRWELLYPDLESTVIGLLYGKATGFEVGGGPSHRFGLAVEAPDSFLIGDEAILAGWS